MTKELALSCLKAHNLLQLHDFFAGMIAAHEKEHSAALACLRQMDKITHENARLKKRIAELSK